ncbi:LLM class flavin-dependent oxidoreductase [Bacillus mycoides]|uniref:LLM class flavin-dependent oxidoreductase n=1 Tax=Bacillus mycoides TaxID=1405 RepID=UPI003D208C87
MEFCWVLPVTREINYKELHDLSIKQSVEAEQYAFDSVLVATIPESLDPWILSTNIVNATNNIRLLVAQNTNHVLPTYVAKSLNTLNLLSNGRIDLNIVTGSSKIGLSKDGTVENHKTRYRRTKEFSEVLIGLRNGPLTYQGEFYSIENAELLPNLPNNDHQADIFLAGSSEDAMNIGAEYADTYLMYANNFEQTSKQINLVKSIAQKHNKKIKCGIYINVIARETSDEAWDAANEILESSTSFEKKLVKIYQNSVDSVGVSQQKEFKEFEDYIVDDHLWGGLAEVSPTVALSIVGSYEEVIKTFQKYYELGVSYFLIVGYCNNNEIERLGKYVLPELKKSIYSGV